MKDFDRWNRVKKNINKKAPLSVKIGEVCWCKFGINIGREQDGDEEFFARPVIVLHSFSKEFILCAPLTSRYKKGNWYTDIRFKDKKNIVILNQIKPIDTRRIIKIMGQISEKEVRIILKKYTDLFIKKL